ncbi:MAG: class I SAM-dependent methyltransferase [Methylacidiphilales bacterium]|nr:class I SAM-dependent methyltransferase [Candidatus Methylacidiphilales bacterium]
MSWGCGNGVAAFILAELGYVAHGIDISATAIAWAKETQKFAGVECCFVQGDVSEMPEYRDGYFQLIFDGACLHCLIGSRRAKAFREVRRIIAEDGTFVLSSMCGVPKRPPHGVIYDAEHELLLRDSTPYRTIRSPANLVSELEAHGFRAGKMFIKENPWWDHLTIVARPSA